MQKFIKLLLILLSPCWLFAQKTASKDTSTQIFMIDFSYAVQLPAADMANRFGWNNNVGSGLSIKSKKNWFYNLSGYFIFGDQIKEDDILFHLKTDKGAIIGVDGRYAEVRLFERGYHFAAGFGRLYNWAGPNANSGILLMMQAGFIQHKIKIDPIGNTVPLLDKEYRKGYDKLTNGIAFTQSARYVHIPHKSFFNFYAGLEITEGLTQNRRSYNFDTRTFEGDNRLDILFGARFGVIIPINRKAAEFYYY